MVQVLRRCVQSVERAQLKWQEALDAENRASSRRAVRKVGLMPVSDAKVNFDLSSESVVAVKEWAEAVGALEGGL